MRTATIALVALALGGCVNLGTGKPPEHLIRLSSEAPVAAGPAVSGKGAGVLVVAEPEADRVLAVQRIAVTVNATDVAYLKGAAWAERPTRLFRALLAENLRAGGKRLVIEDDTDAPAGARRIEGKLLALGYDARSHAVVVRFDALLRGPDGSVALRRFEVVQPHVRPQAKPVAAALNHAANQLANQVAEWVGAAG